HSPGGPGKKGSHGRAGEPAAPVGRRGRGGTAASGGQGVHEGRRTGQKLQPGAAAVPRGLPTAADRTSCEGEVRRVGAPGPHAPGTLSQRFQGWRELVKRP